MNTYYLIGEISVDGGEMLPVEEIIRAETGADALRAMRRYYDPDEITIAEIHRLDDEG